MTHFYSSLIESYHCVLFTKWFKNRSRVPTHSWFSQPKHETFAQLCHKSMTYLYWLCTSVQDVPNANPLLKKPIRRRICTYRTVDCGLWTPVLYYCTTQHVLRRSMEKVPWNGWETAQTVPRTYYSTIFKEEWNSCRVRSSKFEVYSFLIYTVPVVLYK